MSIPCKINPFSGGSDVPNWVFTLEKELKTLLEDTKFEIAWVKINK